MKVIIHTINKYRFCWDGFTHYWRKFWQGDYPIYFCTDRPTITPCFDTIFTEGEELDWSGRLITALEKIEDKYVFYIQEDAWLTKSLPQGVIYSILQTMEREDLYCVRIMKSLKYLTVKRRYMIGDLPTYDCNRESLYLLNHQPSVWNREFLLSCLVKGETPWANEKEGTKRLSNRPDIDGKIVVIHYDWYNAVCRKGQLQDIGIQMLEELK